MFFVLGCSSPEEVRADITDVVLEGKVAHGEQIYEGDFKVVPAGI